MVTILRTGLHLDLPNALVEDSPEQGRKCLIQPALASPRDWCHLEEDRGFFVERSVHLELEELVSLEATRSRAQSATFLGSPCQGHRSVRICLVKVSS